MPGTDLLWINRTARPGSVPALLRVCLLGVLAVGALATSAASTVDTFSFDSAVTEERYRGLIAEIRCPKCQNVNIAGSDAPIAKDLRVTVHRLLGEGLSDQEILDFLQARYGDFVLYDPPLRTNTVLLWLLPVVGFVGGVFVVIRLARQQPAVDELSTVDAQQLDELLAQSPAAGASAGKPPGEQARDHRVGSS